MTIDLTKLALTAMLVPALTLPILWGYRTAPDAFAWALSNRDRETELPPWLARARRAHANLAENLPTVAALVLTAHVAGRADRVTALASAAFFAARAAHAAVYVAGVTGVRTALFAASLAAELAIAARILL